MFDHSAFAASRKSRAGGEGLLLFAAFFSFLYQKKRLIMIFNAYAFFFNLRTRPPSSPNLALLSPLLRFPPPSPPHPAPPPSCINLFTLTRGAGYAERLAA
jgi:hypothetical protein